MRLTQLGAFVTVIGQRIPEDSGNLVLQLPDIPADWQFLIDIIPAQLAAEHLARLSGVDPDSFRYGSYIVESEYGLIQEKVAIPEQRPDGQRAGWPLAETISGSVYMVAEASERQTK